MVDIKKVSVEKSFPYISNMNARKPLTGPPLVNSVIFKKK